MQPEQRFGLIRGGGPGAAPDLRQVPQVVPAFRADPAGAITADPGQLRDDHGQRGYPEHHAGGHMRTGAARGEDQRHGTEPAKGG